MFERINKKVIWKKVCPVLKAYRLKFFCIFLLIVLSSVFSFILPQLTKSIMDEGFIARNFHTILVLSFLLLCVLIMRQAAEYMKESFRINLKKELIYHLYKIAFLHICKSEIKSLDKNRAEMINKLQVDINSISMLIDNTTLFTIGQIFNVIGGLVGLFMIHTKLALIVLFMIPVKYILIVCLSKKREALTSEYINANTSFFKWFENTLAGIQEIKLFALQKYKIKEFSPLMDRNVNLDKKVMLLSVYNSILDSFLIEILTIIIYIVGAVYLFESELTVGSIFAFITYLIYVSAPISTIINFRYVVAGVIPSIYRYLDFLNKTEEPVGGEKIQPVAGLPVVEFKNVKFQYTDNKIVLNELNFKIYPGEKVAIVGKNGTGKSTLVQLLLRFYLPASGAVEMYGRNINAYDLEELRGCFSVVSQDVYLFEGSIKINIILDKTFDLGLFERVIQQANLFDLVDEYTVDYNVGYGGANLSGGQKQKIAIARALYSDHEIYIFDEMSSNADLQTKGIYRKTIFEYLRDKTVLIITHEDELLPLVDKIIKL